MTTNLSSLRRSRFGAIALAILLAATVVGCAQVPANSIDPVAGSGSSTPGQINYQGFPYNIQAG